jgi:hypothetical protein
MDWYRIERNRCKDSIFGYSLIACPEPLKIAEKVAISYIWGSPALYGPRYHHYEIPALYETGCRILKHFQLGAEWQLSNFFQLLFEAVKGRPFWLDQFSLPQDKTIREDLLLEIPRIFASHSVKVLVNSSTCPIFQALTIEEMNYSDYNLLNLAQRRHSATCNACCTVNRWLKRIWPTTELLRASRIQMIFLTGKDPAVFTGSTEPYEGISGIDRQSRAYLIEETAGRQGMLLLQQLGNCLRAKKAFTNPPTRISPNKLALSLLRGEEIVLQDTPTSFFILGAQLMGQHRLATDERDLVSAIWIHLAGYIAPKSEDLSVTQLLRDAVSQYRELCSMEPSTPLTKGCLGLDGPSLHTQIFEPYGCPKDSVSYYGQLGTTWERPVYTSDTKVRISKTLSLGSSDLVIKSATEIVASMNIHQGVVDILLPLYRTIRRGWAIRSSALSQMARIATQETGLNPVKSDAMRRFTNLVQKEGPITTKGHILELVSQASEEAVARLLQLAVFIHLWVPVHLLSEYGSSVFFIHLGSDWRAAWIAPGYSNQGLRLMWVEAPLRPTYLAVATTERRDADPAECSSWRCVGRLVDNWESNRAQGIEGRCV